MHLEPPPAGSLTVVGAGIRAGLHVTQEARGRIEGADKVLYLLAEVAIAPTGWIHAMNPSAESMASMYRPGRPYLDVYEDIVTTILTWVRRDLDVCAVTYGHPGVFDQSLYEAIRRARGEGYRTRILPGISALDCLFLDLELDPGEDGCQLYDATGFLVHARRPDVSVPLILWQISVIGGSHTTGTVDRFSLAILRDRLEALYGADHEVVVYEASPFPVGRPTIERCPVSGLAEAGVTGLSTLYVPPRDSARSDPGMMARLGMT
ncbi:MAG TPA: SAM-dependent methyltransferase [Actinomycetota bacterium]|nr:SAM-dependent methyltransferase [Actinomycetota bacterium]